MKRLGLGVAALAALSALTLTLALPGPAWAQRLKSNDNAPAADAKAGAPAKISDADKARGAKDTPALVAASNVKSCQVTDSAFRGAGSQKGADGKTVKVTLYEVACRTGPGYLVIAQEGVAKPQMSNCIIAAGGGTKCVLPQNADTGAALAGYVRETGRTCDISGQRYVGSGSSGMTYYEVGCRGAAGFLMAVNEAAPAGAKPDVTDCLQLQGTAQACQLTTREQSLAVYQPLVARAGKTCQVSDVRTIGADRNNGDLFTEIACGSTPGFILVQTAGGAFKSAVDCGKAESLGGCKMTDTAVAQTTDAAAYTKLAAKAGFPCQVKQYRYIGTDAQNREVVELACSDRPDGALAAFSETGKSDVYDCVRAPALGGQGCKLTQADVVYPKYTASLAAKGRNTCKVSGAGYLGGTQQGVDYVETACADGAPGWVIGFTRGTNTAADLLTCKQASNVGLPCKLPTNTAGNKG